jgi:hypothetical protein
VVLGGGLGNLKALQILTIYSIFGSRTEEGYDDDEEDALKSLYWQAFANALGHVRQKIELRLDGGSSWFENKVNRFTCAIQGLRNIWIFNSWHVIVWDEIHELLSALATLVPSLEIAIIGHYPFGEDYPGFGGIFEVNFDSPESLTELLKLPSLRSIEFSRLHFKPDLCQALLAAFNEGSVVTDLRLTDCFLGHDDNWENLGRGRNSGILHALQRSTKLETLYLVGNDFDSLFYEAMAAILLTNTTLKDLTLQITPALQFAKAWLQPLFVAMRINTSLKSVNVNDFRLSDASVLSALQVMLAKNSALEELTLYFEGSLRDTTVTSLRSTLPFRRDNKTLKSLTIVFGEEAIHMDPHIATLCIDTVAILEGTLECLEIQNTKLSPDKYFTAFAKLQSNTTLKTLRLYPNLHSICDVKIIKQMISETSLLKKNCTLSFWTKVCMHSYDPKRELGALLRLNKAGRHYLLDDVPSIVKGIKVLSDISDDLDCVFLHLLENPLLCDITRRSIEAETDAHRKKRQRIPN